MGVIAFRDKGDYEKKIREISNSLGFQSDSIGDLVKMIVDSLHSNLNVYKQSLNAVRVTETNLQTPILPFETKDRPIGKDGLVTSQTSLPRESPLMKNGKPDITLFNARRQETLLFERMRLAQRVEAAREMEEMRRETNRQNHARRPQTDIQRDEAFLKRVCPNGHDTLFCYTHTCDRRGQCHREGVIGKPSHHTENVPCFLVN